MFAAPALSSAATLAPTVVIDNGACYCRTGFAGEAEPRLCCQNAVAKPKGDSRLLVGPEIDEHTFINQLNVKRPMDRGYLANGKMESAIWAKVLDTCMPEVNPADSHLLMTEPLFNLVSIQRTAQEIAFEDFGFRSMHAVTAAELSLHKWAADNRDSLVAKSLSGIVLDAGYSFTHAVPIFDGKVQLNAVRRIRIGGKLLTNLMKEWVSYRSMNLKDEPYLMEVVKDQVCYVARDVRVEMPRCFPKRKSSVLLEYVLPDGVSNTRGYVRDPNAKESLQQPTGTASSAPPAATEAVLHLTNERFMTMEALFNPVDIGVQQAGVGETLAQSLDACHPAIRSLLAQNILLTGGTSSCPGFKARLELEVRPWVDDLHDVVVNQGLNPACSAWHGGSICGTSQFYRNVAVTRAEYEEQGALRTAAGL